MLSSKITTLSVAQIKYLWTFAKHHIVSKLSKLGPIDDCQHRSTGSALVGGTSRLTTLPAAQSSKRQGQLLLPLASHNTTTPCPCHGPSVSSRVPKLEDTTQSVNWVKDGRYCAVSQSGTKLESGLHLFQHIFWSFLLRYKTRASKGVEFLIRLPLVVRTTRPSKMGI